MLIRMFCGVVMFMALVRLGENAVMVVTNGVNDTETYKIEESSDALLMEVRDDIIAQIKDYINTTVAGRLDGIQELFTEFITKQRYQDICVSNGNPCERGGTCVISEHDMEFHCECQDGWTGQTCQEREVIYEWQCHDAELYDYRERVAYTREARHGFTFHLFFHDDSDSSDSDDYEGGDLSHRMRMKCEGEGGVFTDGENYRYVGCNGDCLCCYPLCKYHPCPSRCYWWARKEIL